MTGESFIAEHAQAITASSLGILPRIMPAPQALLRPLRPASLPTYNARLVGVHTGTVLDSVGFFANLIHPLDQMAPFAFRVLEIRHRHLVPEPSVQESTTIPLERSGKGVSDTGVRSRKAAADTDPETGTSPKPLNRRPTLKDQISSRISNRPSLVDEPPVAARLNSPLHLLSMVSFLMTLGLIIAAGVWNDGTAIIAVSLISIASSIICYAASWRPLLLTRSKKADWPGDLVIRTYQGAFLVVKCTDEVARELYTGAQECEYYHSGAMYIMLMTAGAVMIMPSVILMGNCSFNMQVLMGAAYMILNVAYWLLSILPPHLFWDLSRYKWADVTPVDCRGNEVFDGSSVYSKTLWYAIRETKSTAWIPRSGAVPNTPQWRKWYDEAQVAAVSGNRDWPAVERKETIMRESLDESEKPAKTYDTSTQTAGVDDWELD